MERRVNLSECLKEGKMKNCCRRDVKMNSLEAKSGAVSIWDNYSAFPTSPRLFFAGSTMKVITMRCFITPNDTSPFPFCLGDSKLRKAEAGVGGDGGGGALRSEEDRTLGRVGETPIRRINGTRSFRLPRKSLACCQKKLKRIMWEK